MGLLYTGMKVFHFKEKVDSLPVEVKSILPPVHIRIKPTNVCNHNCWYCAYKAEGLQLGQDMGARDSIPREKIMEIVDDLAEMGVKAVTFSGGGEPFCYPHLAETARKLSGRSIQFAALTNGSRLNGEVAEIFSEKGCWIRVSMDGWDDASYSEYRRVPEGEFSKVLDNMRKFKKLGGNCYLGVSVIVDQKNAGHLHEFIAKLSDVGVDSVKVSPCVISNDGAENNAYHKKVFDLAKSEIDRADADFSNDHFEIYDAYHELDAKFTKDYHWCPYLQVLPVIGADLNIYPCQDKAYNLAEGLIGSIKEQRFKDFWFSNKDKFFKIDPSKHCDHHCVANMKNKMIHEYLSADPGHLGFV